MTKTVLVTGATSGIGLAFCKAYAKKGLTIILVARTSAKLSELFKELSGKHGIFHSRFITEECYIGFVSVD